MTTGNEIREEDHITGFREEIDRAVIESKDSFFVWFSNAENTDASFVRGQWDFSIHIAQPMSTYLQQPEDKNILEIGHGGGRILAAAAQHFSNAVGVDIHNQNEFVETELRERGLSNFKLYMTDGLTYPLDDNSIDVAYSFIVFQHVEKMEILVANLQELHRVLKPNGIAVVYFGRKRFSSYKKTSELLYKLDCMIERFYLRRGYKEMPARVNSTNLVVTAAFAKKKLRQSGFNILKQMASRKNVPDGAQLYGGQHGFVVKK